MEVVADDAGGAAPTEKVESVDLGFLPKSLTTQCRSLIESYHELHGYALLPNILWKAKLGPFIESHREFRQLLKKASTTRSAKKSNEGFVRIAMKILALEILASSFAGWSAIYPEAGSLAQCARAPYAPDGILPLSAETHLRGRDRDARPTAGQAEPGRPGRRIRPCERVLRRQLMPRIARRDWLKLLSFFNFLLVRAT